MAAKTTLMNNKIKRKRVNLTQNMSVSSTAERYAKDFQNSLSLIISNEFDSKVEKTVIHNNEKVSFVHIIHFLKTCCYSSQYDSGSFGP